MKTRHRVLWGNIYHINITIFLSLSLQFNKYFYKDIYKAAVAKKKLQI